MATLLERLARSFRKRLYRLKGGGSVREIAPGLHLMEYGADPQAYERYRAEQDRANRCKLERSWVSEDHVAFLAAAIIERLGPVAFGLCHGTRRGYEQSWFKAHLPGEPRVIGTEIASTADEFPDTVRWDFHDENPEWTGRADFVYSNSWDHAFDPARAFRAWVGQLRPGGLLLLDHSAAHAPRGERIVVNFTDPFAATKEGLEGFLRETFGHLGAVEPSLSAPRPINGAPCTVILFRRGAAA